MQLWRSIKTKWRNYRIARAEKVLEGYGRYKELGDKILSLEAVVKTRDSDYSKALEDRVGLQTAYDAKTAERDRENSDLKQELNSVKDSLNVIEREYAKLQIDYKTTIETIESAKTGTVKLENALILAKKFIFDYREKINGLTNRVSGLEKEMEGKKNELEVLFEVKEKEMAVEYRGGLARLADSCEALYREALKGFNESIARAKANLDEETKKFQLDSDFFSLILKYRDENTSFKNSNCLVLNNAGKPIYATKGFYKFFAMSRDSDLSNFPLRKEVVEQSKDWSRSVARKKLTLNWRNQKNKDVPLDLDIRNVANAQGNNLGCIVEYNHHQGTLGKILTFGGRKHAMDKFDEFYGSEGEGKPADGSESDIAKQEENPLQDAPVMDSSKDITLEGPEKT